MVKYPEQQQWLRESKFFQQVIEEGIQREDEDISVRAARKNLYLQCIAILHILQGVEDGKSHQLVK